MRWQWKLGRIIAYILAKTFLGFRVIGRENLLRDSPQILAANHRSHMDPILVGLASGQEIYFMAKEDLFQISKFFKWLISFWNAIPLPRGSRTSEALKKCSTLLKNGKTVVIFPEGTRNKFENLLLPFKPGFGFLAVNNQVPITPVAIAGVREVWNGRLSAFIDRDISQNVKCQISNAKRNNGITVRFGKPVFPNGIAKNRDGYEQIAQMVQKDIELLLKVSNETTD
jgi:1-acyl-sn-glycerol-3-phosphate acyltransferase